MNQKDLRQAIDENQREEMLFDSAFKEFTSAVNALQQIALKVITQVMGETAQVINQTKEQILTKKKELKRIQEVFEGQSDL